MSVMVTNSAASVGYHAERDLHPPFAKAMRLPEFWGWSVARANGEVPRHSIEYLERPAVSVSYGANGARIAAPWASLCQGQTLLYAALPFIELQHQLLGYTTAHAACVALPQGAVLLLGKSGAGKTVTAIELCRKFGGRLVGNDLVSVGIDHRCGRVMARGGSQFLYLRHESIRRNLPDLLALFDGACHADSWLWKVKIDPVQLSIRMETELVPIIAAFQVHVDNAQQQLHVEPADGVVTRITLNENFSRYIRGASLNLLGSDFQQLGYIPSFDSPALHEQRCRLIDRLTSQPPMMYVSGAVGQVANYIATRGGAA